MKAKPDGRAGSTSPSRETHSGTLAVYRVERLKDVLDPNAYRELSEAIGTLPSYPIPGIDRAIEDVVHANQDIENLRPGSPAIYAVACSNLRGLVEAATTEFKTSGGVGAFLYDLDAVGKVAGNTYVERIRALTAFHPDITRALANTDTDILKVRAGVVEAIRYAEDMEREKRAAPTPAPSAAATTPAGVGYSVTGAETTPEAPSEPKRSLFGPPDPEFRKKAITALGAALGRYGLWFYSIPRGREDGWKQTEEERREKRARKAASEPSPYSPMEAAWAPEPLPEPAVQAEPPIDWGAQFGDEGGKT